MLKEDWRQPAINRVDAVMPELERAIEECGDMTAQQTGEEIGESVHVCLLAARISDVLWVDDENHQEAVIRMKDDQ